MYVRGTAKLSNGRALVRLPEHFRVLADATSITVQLTPNSADTYGLATVKKTPANIEVRELGGSKGNFSFDYVVVAARSDLPPLKVVRKRNSARPDDAPSDGNSGGDLFDREEPDADSGTKEEEEPDREPPRLGDSPPRTPGSQAN
jgi:hypothetical protein